MKIRDSLFPIIIIPVGILFITISLFVILSKGKNKKLINSKLKIGAFILSFSYFTACGKFGATCYEPAPLPNSIEISYNNSLFNQGDTVFGNIYEGTFTEYFFELKDSLEEKIVQKGDLIASDGAFDDANENFYFILDSTVSYGFYFVDFYGKKSDQPDNPEYISRSHIQISYESNTQ